MSRLKAAFFDLDDTLCDDAGIWIMSATNAAQIAVERQAIQDAAPLVTAFLRRSEAYWMSLEPIKETRPLIEVRREQWAAALGEVAGFVDDDLSLSLAQDYGERRSKGIQLFPDVVDTLTVLRDCDVQLALLTNGVQLTHKDKIEFLGLDLLFDHLLIADAVGSFKPEPTIFREALRRCDCRPDQAVMVGDHLNNDVGGAQAVGLDGYWFNPEGTRRGPRDPVPKGEIKALSEILTILEPRLS